MKMSTNKIFYPISLIVLLPLFFIFAGCETAEYAMVSEQSEDNKASIYLPQNIKKIAISDFQDKTGHILIDEKLTLEVKDAFVEDARVAVVSLADADALLQGEIIRYLIQPIAFDDSYTATEYQLWIWINISFGDIATKKVLWVEKRLEAKIIYKINDPGFDGPITELEAQDAAVEILADSIVKRTIDGWFAASGVSERM